MYTPVYARINMGVGTDACACDRHMPIRPQWGLIYNDKPYVINI
jgi:hypothetical protein